MAKNKHPEETVALILDKSLELFLKKGYESTSIQDIINELGGLSKGAIYHHFKSKDEIFEAVCNKIGEQNCLYYDGILNMDNLNGLEKLKFLFKSAYLNPNNQILFEMFIQFLNEPRFFMSNIYEIYEIVAPKYVQPILEEGIKDGTIQSSCPKELAEVLMTLINVWLNPVINKASLEEFRNKINYLCQVLHALNLDIFDDEMLEEYVLYCSNFVK